MNELQIFNYQDNQIRTIADKGLKQRAVAAKAGFSEKQFSALMTGRRIIKDSDVMAIAIAIAIALDATPNDLFGYPTCGTSQSSV